MKEALEIVSRSRFPWVFILFLFVCGSLGAAPFSLSEEEMAFIEEHPEIRLGVDPEFVPFEFIDSDGSYGGIAADILRLISDLTGLHFTVDADLPWVEAVEAIRQREVDVLPAVGWTEERARYLLFSRPYITFQRVIVVRNTNQSIDSFHDLYGRQVAVQENSSHHGFLLEYPEITIRTYPTVREALLAVNRGEEVAFVGNQATTAYIARANGMTEFSMIPFTEGEALQLHFAVRNDWPLLLSILDKSLQAISEQQFADIYNQWIIYETRMDREFIIRIVTIVVLVVLCVSGASLFWIIRLKKEVRRKESAQREAEAARGESERAALERSRFMARMSHEIRTPLNGISGMTFLLERTPLDMTQSRYVSTIKQTSAHMLSIINDILDFSRIGEMSIQLERIPFNLDSVIHQVVSVDHWMTGEKKLSVTVERDPKVPVRLIGDPTRLFQILSNLFHNAVKFTQKGGITIQVSSQGEQEGKVVLSFLVRDTGIGMTDSQLDVLFKPFNQADGTIARKFGGSGLGLSIVKSLVELMEGSISVESIPGSGSSFFVSLPFLLDAAGSRKERELLDSVDFSSRKVLLVLRDDDVYRIISSCLSSYNMQYDRIGSLDLAVPLLAAAANNALHRYDLVVLGEHEWEKDHAGLLFGPSSPKILLILEDAAGWQVDPQGSRKVDMILPKPVIPSILFNALLELFPPHAPLHPEEGKKPVSHQAFPPYHVLVVEDNAINRMIAKEVLEQEGLRVTLASDGKEGVERFSTVRDGIDVVLMDLHMEVMDGYEATRRIRAIDSKVPVIALTADVIGTVDQKCREAGFSSVISKPYDPGELVKTLVELASERESSTNQGSIDFPTGLANVGNDETLYSRVLAMFAEEQEPLLSRVKELLQKNAFAEVSEVAHKIKGGCAAIGAVRAGQAAAKVQQVSSSKDPDGVSEAFRELETEFARVITEIHRWLASHNRV